MFNKKLKTMIVSTMNVEEIRAEVFRDLPSVLAKSNFHAPALVRWLYRSGQLYMTTVKEYVTVRKNKWLLVFRVNRKESVMRQALPFYDDKGYLVAVPYKVDGEKYLCIFTGHFFQRFDERMKLKLAQPQVITQKFFKRNEVELADHAQSELENEENKQAVFINFKDGAGLGIMELNKRLMTIKTFLPHEMLKEPQQRLVEHIKNPEEVDAVEDHELMMDKVVKHLKPRLD